MTHRSFWPVLVSGWYDVFLCWIAYLYWCLCHFSSFSYQTSARISTSDLSVLLEPKNALFLLGMDLVSCHVPITCSKHLPGELFVPWLEVGLVSLLFPLNPSSPLSAQSDWYSVACSISLYGCWHNSDDSLGFEETCCVQEGIWESISEAESYDTFYHLKSWVTMIILSV